MDTYACANRDEALQTAVGHGYLELVKTLLAAGADRTKVENFDQKLLEMI